MVQTVRDMWDAEQVAGHLPVSALHSSTCWQNSGAQEAFHGTGKLTRLLQMNHVATLSDA